MPDPQPFKQTRQPRELRLVAEFLASQYPNERVMTQVRLGPINPTMSRPELTNAERMVIGNFRRSADGVVLLRDWVLIVEGYMVPHLGKASQLLAYMRLFPTTPELKEFSGLPIRGLLVGPIEDPILSRTASDFFIGFQLFRPDWAVEYLKGFGGRFQRDRSSG